MPARTVTRPTAKRRPIRGKASRRKYPWIRIAIICCLSVGLCFYLGVALCLFLLRWVDPPTTAVQMERRVGAWIDGRNYIKRYNFVAEDEISPNLQHAVIAAEDARFFTHHGFDWKEMRASVDKALDGGKPRGASTLTQQLARNLFLSTQPSLARKGVEMSIVPLAEHILGKQRILELYLNVVEWGPGVFGAEAAARFYFHESAAKLSRNQALELASILPAPSHRRPGHTEWYVTVISTRMHELGW